MKRCRRREKGQAKSGHPQSMGQGKHANRLKLKQWETAETEGGDIGINRCQSLDLRQKVD